MATARAGDLRDKVGFYRPVTTDDGFGNTQIGFGNAPSVMVAAHIVAKLGGEAVLQGRLAGTNYVNITVRVSAATKQIDDSWKAKNMRAGVEYNIRSIVDPYMGTPRRGRFLEMLCEQGVAQ